MTLAVDDSADLSEAPDGVLLTKVPSDRAAMGELARRYAGYVHAVARRQTGDANLADDVTQAVFLVLWRKADRINPQALSSWLHQTTRYATANALRAHRRRQFHESRAARTEAVVRADAEDAAALQTVLDDAIASLPKGDRQLIIDRYLRQVDLVAVAGGIGTTPAAAQKRIERAMARLRAAMSRRLSRGDGVAVSAAGVAAVLNAATPSAPSTALLHAIVSPSMASAPALAIAKSLSLASLSGTAKALAGGVLLVILAFFGFSFMPEHSQAQSSPAGKESAAKGAATQPRFSPPVIGRLKSGGMVEFIGVAEGPSDQHEWFGADGNPVELRPYPGMPGMPPGANSREYAFRLGQGSAFYEVQTDSNLILVRSWKRAAREFFFTSPSNPRDAKKGVDGYVFPSNDAAAGPSSLRFEFSTKAWQTLARSQRGQVVSSKNDAISVRLDHTILSENVQASVAYTEAAVDDEKQRLQVVRVVAIDKNGSEHATVLQDLNTFSSADVVAIPQLNQRVASRQLSGKSLGDVIAYLQENAGIAIETDHSSLATAGYDLSKPVRLRADNLTVAQVLHDSLLTASMPKTPLVAFVERDGIRIGPEALFRGRLPRVYSVQDQRAEQIDHFEVRVRQFDEWIQFENLPPKPGQAAEVIVRTSDDRVSREGNAEQLAALRPGVAIGKVELGMTRQQVVQILGRPQLELGGTPHWTSRGISVIFDTGGHAATLMGGNLDPEATEARLSARTAEGLGLGSTAEQVIAACGPPDKPTPSDGGTTFISYWKRGIEFKLRNDKVYFLTVMAVD